MDLYDMIKEIYTEKMFIYILLTLRTCHISDLCVNSSVSYDQEARGQKEEQQRRQTVCHMSVRASDVQAKRPQQTFTATDNGERRGGWVE